jgi:thiol-disulfide isomerase/thioredoxin
MALPMFHNDPSSGVPGGPRRRARRWLKWAVEAALVVLVVFAMQWWQARDVPRGPAPGFSAPLADGGAISLAEFRAAHPGTAVGVYFWAEWCAICKAQQGSVEAVRSDWPVLTVAMQSGAATAVAKALQERGLDWPTAIDPNGSIAARYGLHGVPAFVVVDRQGEVRSVAVGYTTTLGLRLRLWWAGLPA